MKDAIQKKQRNRKISPKHEFYNKLRDFRVQWEANGGTRRSLRQARREQKTLFPTA